MITQILFEVPALFEAGLKSGAISQIGGLLKDTATGQILAHLQESSLAHSLIGNAMLGAASPVNLALQAGSIIPTAYTAIQVTQLKSMMSTLQSLQIATLGVSLVGVGVSVAGFVYMHKRFNSLDNRIDTLIDTVNTGFENQQKASLRAHMSQVKGLVQLAKQAESLSSPDKEYSRVADSLADQASFFEGEIEFVSRSSQKVNLEIFWQLAQVLMVCNSVRIDCRMRTNELLNAQTIAESAAADYQRLFSPLTPASFDARPSDGAIASDTIKDITDAASTKPYLIDYLRTIGVNGREYIQTLEGEVERPLLMLKVN
jgi:hypothetical protein